VPGDAAKQGSKYRIEALAKGLQVLRQFDEQTVSLKLSEISRATGIPLPTAFRIVATLEDEGYLERTSEGDYQPGIAALLLGSAALRASSLVQIAEGPLRELAERTGETVNLGVLHGDQVLYLIRLRNSDLVTANVQVGSTLPAVYTSMGKLLLAFAGDEVLDATLSEHSFRPGAGPNALPGVEALRKELQRIRKQGYSIQDQELALGLRSVSFPITDGGGRVVAAVNIAVSSARHDVRTLRTTLLTALRAAGEDISRKVRNT
jgi:IclR family pca regulon transcriptional regulator